MSEKTIFKIAGSRFSETICFVYICEGANINSSLKQVVNMFETRSTEKCPGTVQSFPHIKNDVLRNSFGFSPTKCLISVTTSAFELKDIFCMLVTKHPTIFIKKSMQITNVYMISGCPFS